MTNYGSPVILAALRGKVPTRDLSRNELSLLLAKTNLLIILETFPADEHGTRSVGMEELARQAQLPLNTARRARDALTADGLVEYKPGMGRGNFTQWRFLFELKVPTQGEDLSDELKVPTTRDKGTHLNRSTRHNADHALSSTAKEKRGRASASRRALRCDRKSAGRLSDRCRGGDGKKCPKQDDPTHWCECQCHT